MDELLDYVKNKQHDESRQGEALNIELEATEFKNDKYFYIESYGCQMNFSDSEIVASILANQGYSLTADIFKSDLILLNTCAVRDKAEQTVRKRLQSINELKEQKPGMMIGMLGCMAERLKSKLLEEEKLVDIVVGPDAYRSLPELIAEAEGGQKAVNVLLSREETYADISPVRLDKNGVTAFISIMRGCDNMCSFCVVPFTRGRERSRDPESIVAEVKDLFKRGYKEVTLLGQNVDSYAWRGEGKNDDKEAEVLVNFAQLLEKVALVNPELRVRFSTSHPKDITDDVLYAIAKYENICKYIHLPVQSGSSSCLKRMNRTYDRDWYINRVDAIKRIIPDCGLSSDMIAGFCGETEEEHQDTLSMMDYVRYDYSYMFYYSERPGTLAARKYPDDVEESVKKRRLQEIIDKQNQLSIENNRKDIGKIYKVLIEKTSKKSTEDFSGRNSQNKMIVFPRGNAKIGDYVNVLVETITQGTLIGKIV
ncbi:MAG: tRNA (N6-isopentenyl adenosine(37)-C2)-methylthiotransferase MiaB [Chitinophagales bacterium]